MRNKYNAKKVVVDGEVFHSKKEARRWQELKLLEKAGKITFLKRQEKYLLIPTQREIINDNGNLKAGKVVERECAYIADFTYLDKDSMEMVVEDTKGVRTADYILKRKMMLYFHGIKIKEV